MVNQLAGADLRNLPGDTVLFKKKGVSYTEIKS